MDKSQAIDYVYKYQILKQKISQKRIKFGANLLKHYERTKIYWKLL